MQKNKGQGNRQILMRDDELHELTTVRSEQVNSFYYRVKRIE